MDLRCLWSQLCILQQSILVISIQTHTDSVARERYENAHVCYHNAGPIKSSYTLFENSALLALPFLLTPQRIGDCIWIRPDRFEFEQMLCCLSFVR